ncbi:MAG: chemotaxis protein CheA [Candidatus Omnitrophica bacterium]|nr:chemotaxis protein CheA [Candidatus Omnitrophota bacterium]
MNESAPISAAHNTGKSAPVEVSTLRIDSRKLDLLMNMSGELVTLRAQFSRLVALFRNELMTYKEMTKALEELKDSSLQMVSSKLDVERRKKSEEQFVRLIGNVEQYKNELNFTAQVHSFDELTGMLGKLASDIQSGIMQTRMIPVEWVFTRFKRVIRDMAKELNKNVDLKVEGEDTELDKKIVDCLADPLTHMIRNAMDHGIDDKETRLKLGKPEIGTVFLKAANRGNTIFIEVGDDGRGIDPERLVKKAIEKGIINQEQAQRMSEKEKLHLMFLPGFSTAEAVTAISGRGVGLDVVTNMLNAVNGTIDIETKIDMGSKFILKIPLTLAIIQALLIKINEQVFAVPIEAVIEIIKVSTGDIYSIEGNDTVKLRGHALSLVSLEQVIKIQGCSEKNGDGLKTVVVIGDKENRIGVLVDSLIGEDEIVIKPLSEHFSHVKGVSGASILGDGNVVLILDPNAIISEAQ